MRASSLCSESQAYENPIHSYRRSCSHPALLPQQERAASTLVRHTVRQHTVSSPSVEKTYEFQSNSDCLSLGKYEILQAFISKHDAITGKPADSMGSASPSDDLYFTLEPIQSMRTVTDSIQRSEHGEAARC